MRRRFEQNEFLPAFDFFCIVIWKANRAKSSIAEKLCNKTSQFDHLDQAVKSLTQQIAKASSKQEKMKVLVEEWKFGLPMASAILTVLYPDDFTVYDVRVAQLLDKDRKRGCEFSKLIDLTAFETVWEGYRKFMEEVKNFAPQGVQLRSLREKDQYLWGKSFHDQLVKNTRDKFRKGGE